MPYDPSVNRADFNVWPDDESMLALGKFLSAWSTLETLMQGVFITLSSTNDKLGRMVFGQLATRQQIDLLREMAVHLFKTEEDSALLLASLKEIQILSEKRNRLVHASWGISDGIWIRVANVITPFKEQNWESGVRGNKHHASLVDKNTFTGEEIDALTNRVARAVNDLGHVVRSIARAPIERE